MTFNDEVLNCSFSQAKERMKSLSDSEIRDSLLEIGFDEGSIAPYGFICSCLGETESSSLHYLASELLTTALCHLPGAYQLAFFHSKRAIELSPDNVSLKEHLLLFYEIPEQLLSLDEARRVAGEILVQAPDSAAALTILKA